MDSAIVVNVDPKIMVTPTTPSQGLPTCSSPCKKVRFSDDMTQEKKSYSKPLVSPPVQPSENLLERLYAEIATLPMTRQEALTPTQLRILDRHGEEELEKIKAAVTLSEMRRSAMGVVEHHDACSEPLERSDGIRSPEETPEKNPRIVGEEMDPRVQTARKLKTRSENGIPREIEASLEKFIQQNTTSLKANPRKMTRTLAVTPKAASKKVQPRKRCPTKITLHLTTPKKGISKAAKASPGQPGQVHGSAEKRDLELAWLEECKRAKAHFAAGHAQAGI